MLGEFTAREADAWAHDGQDELDGQVRRAHSFWRNVQRFEVGASLRRLGKLASAQRFAVVSGWCCEMKLLQDGRRQIFGFMLPHEVASLPGAEDTRREVIALTRVEVIDWAAGMPQLGPVAARTWEQTEDERESRMFDQMVRLGRLTAEERLLNLFLDFYHRLKAAGLVKADTLKLPLTQELLADALGLSVVHINRTMQKLRAKGYITLRCGSITLHRPEHLARLACYELTPSQLSPAPADTLAWRPRDLCEAAEARHIR